MIGIYYLYHYNEVVYVGSSKDIDERIRQHISLRKQLFDRYELKECKTPKEAKKLEIAEIKRLYPCYNFTHNPKKNKVLNALFLFNPTSALAYKRMLEMLELLDRYDINK